jgi:hypothetical protein
MEIGGRFVSKVVLGKKRNFALADLNYQYVPGLTSDDIWHGDMSLPNSPQVELLQLLIKHGPYWDAIENCRFVQDRRYRRAKGVKKWTEEAIKEHIFLSRWRMLIGIKSFGYSQKRCKGQPVVVLRKPLFNGGLAPEIFHGGRRCAAAYVLGHTELPGHYGKLVDKSRYARWK